MLHSYRVYATLLTGFLLFPKASPVAEACAPVSRVPVVNADQSVIILWNPATQTEHFIRQASFKSEDKSLGFIIPSPTQPDLSESGDQAFAALASWTAPAFQGRSSSSGGCGCAANVRQTYEAGAVRVLNQKRVAGFDAVVLEADSSRDLAGWLTQHGYELSPAVAEWAAPYVAARWKFTALKVVDTSTETSPKDAATTVPINDRPNAATTRETHAIHAAALHMRFKTDRPLFPYREPNSAEAAKTLNASDRLLRIFFISDSRYEGKLTAEVPWTGVTVWADKLDESKRSNLLSLLALPSAALPGNLFLTEFEDHWPYRRAPADLSFSPDASQKTFRRPPVSAFSKPGSFDVATIGACGAIVLRTGKRLAKGARLQRRVRAE